MTVQGRGAWTPRGKATGNAYYTYRANRPVDGTTPEELGEDPLGIEDREYEFWYDRVSRGVRGIQILLDTWGYDIPKAEKGMFGPATDAAIRDFQALHIPPADGLVGPNTMRELLRPTIISAATGKFHPKWLYAKAMKESGMDPGAQGQLNNPDSGIWQFNLRAGTDITITEDELRRAYNPVIQAHATAKRFDTALEEYSGKGRRLMIDCAIAQHNSPLWANQWFAAGEPPNSTIEAYVGLVREYAREWELYA